MQCFTALIGSNDDFHGTIEHSCHRVLQIVEYAPANLTPVWVK